MIAVFPQLISCAESRDVERLTCLVRTYFGGEKKFSSRLNIQPILAAIGIQTVSHQGKGIGSLAVRDQAGRFDVQISLTPNQSQDEATFLLANLLGHYFLTVQPIITKGGGTFGIVETVSPMQRYINQAYQGYQDNQRQALDQDADRFAAAMVLPLGMFQRAAAKIESKDKLGHLFGVPADLITARKRQLTANLSTDNTPAVAIPKPGRPSLTQKAAAIQALLAKTPEPRNLAQSALVQAPARAADPKETAAKVQRTLAHVGYRNQTKPSPVSSDSKTEAQERSPRTTNPSLKGLKKLRALAKRIDSNVPP